jgi:ADP-ribose pyrophosphatase
MTTANMKLVTVSVSFEGQLETPIQKLEEGEHIVKRVVPLDELNAELNGELLFVINFHMLAF